MIYWLSFREGLQRIFLFTQEQRTANYIIKTKFHENCDVEALVSLSGIGLSIFTNPQLKREYLYAGISDVPAVWEVNIGHKWKVLTLELASWIEDKYKLHYKKCQLKDYVHIDFDKMFMLKPFFAELRRSYTSGVYLQYRKSASYQFVDFKVQAVQIDDKYCNGGIVMNPIPSENIRSQTPFFEMEVFRNSFKHCNIYKFIKINVADFYLNIDDGLLLHLQNLYSDCGRTSATESVNLYMKDMASIHTSVCSQIKVRLVEFLAEVSWYFCRKPKIL